MSIKEVEQEGWKWQGRGAGVIWFNKKATFKRATWTAYKASMYYDTKDNWMGIYLHDNGDDHYVFDGKCNSIEEFKTICNLTGLNG